MLVSLGEKTQREHRHLKLRGHAEQRRRHRLAVAAPLKLDGRDTFLLIPLQAVRVSPALRLKVPHVIEVAVLFFLEQLEPVVHTRDRVFAPTPRLLLLPAEHMLKARAVLRTPTPGVELEPDLEQLVLEFLFAIPYLAHLLK